MGTVVAGSPAERAGLLPEDNIILVDGRSVADKSTAEVTARMLPGSAGTPVKPTVRRAGRPQPLDITVVGEPLPTASTPPSPETILP